MRYLQIGVVHARLPAPLLMPSLIFPQVAAERKWCKSQTGAKGVPLFGRSTLVKAIMKQEFDRGSDVLCTV